MRIPLYHKTFSSPIAWGILEDDVVSYIYIEFCWHFGAMPFFHVEVPNKAFNSLNIFQALLRALESESIGMQKYGALKQQCRQKKIWHQL